MSLIFFISEILDWCCCSFGGNLTAYVQNGTIPLSRLDDMGQSKNPYACIYLCLTWLTFVVLLATRILAGWYFLGQDAPSYPKTNFNAFSPDDDATNERSEYIHCMPTINTLTHVKTVDVQADHYKVVRQIGAAGTVLLKNTRGALPLNKPRNIVLIGSDAGPGRIGPNEFTDQVGVYEYASTF